MSSSKLWSSALLAGALIVHASPKPMEPAARTLFVFVHGINPKCSGAIDNANDADAHRSRACEDAPLIGSEEPALGPFCVDRRELLGRAAQVWVKALDNERSENALFCVLHRELFDGNYSLRSFSDPGESPRTLAHELGDRDWSTPQNANLRSHAMEAMRRYAETRRDRALAKQADLQPTTPFEVALLGYGTAPITDLQPIFTSFADSMPNRMVVLAHSMGGLTAREYLVSDFYADDVDKVVTFDSPHAGSWVAKYNMDGVRSGWSTPAKLSAVKLSFAFLLFAGAEPTGDALAAMLTINAASGLTTSLFESYGGYIGNDFKGDEEGSRYLVPGSDALTELNNRTEYPCEEKGCDPPKFVLYSTDGVLAPDDPRTLLASTPLRALLPTNLADIVGASVLAGSRDWPQSTGPGEILYKSFLAAMFAEGGWNYTQHGSLPVSNNSGNGNGIPLLARDDLGTVRRDPLVYDETWGMDAAALAAWRAVPVGTVLLTHTALLPAVNLTAALLGAPSLAQPIKFLTSVGVGVALGSSAVVQFGVYAKTHAPSHNLALVRSAFEIDPASYPDANGDDIALTPRWIEDDLYEAPFVQLRADRENSTADGPFVLRVGSGLATPTAVHWKISEDALSPIEYSRPGWEQRWAIREETQREVGSSGTTVRDVKRWSLPFELLTTDDVRRLELLVDDLRPDRLEQLSLTVNWGTLQLVWDRERDAGGRDLGTYRISRFASGSLAESRSGEPNPVDAYGRWTIDFDAFLPGQILRDGRNLMSISLVNHVGKRSNQFQYILRQATPPLVDVHFPHPWETVSGSDGHLSARITLLHYDGLSIDPDRSGWALERGNILQQSHEEGSLTPFGTLESGASETELDRPLGDLADGEWTNLFRTVSTTREGQRSTSERRVPFLLDRSAPDLRCTGSSNPTRPGVSREFVLLWTDGDPTKPSVLELVRPRILDAQGNIVVELVPLPFLAGRKLVLRWNGMIDDRPAPDGTYTLVVDARDAAVPDAATRSRILELRKELSSISGSWTGTWEPRLDAEWTALRARSDLNWSASRFEFRLDATAPEAIFDALPTKPLSRDERLHVRFRLRDPDAPNSRSSLRVHLEFTPIEGTTETIHSLDATYEDVAESFPAHFDRGVGEFESEGRFLLPDGTWKISGHAEDEAGNRTTWADLGRVRIDRTPPDIASLRTSSIVLPAGVDVSGSAVLDAPGAAIAEAVWVSPDGTRHTATPNEANGIWTFGFPAAMGDTKGIWNLEVRATDEAGNDVHGRTQVWVGLLPPKLVIAGMRDDEPLTVSGPIAIEGIAMDPEVDDHEFVSYALQWRWVGESEWRTEGMHVPAGRGFTDAPWKSRREMNHQGLLGFWTPPQGSGAIELRVLVDDGSGELPGREAIREVYRGADTPLDFTVDPQVDPDLGASISTRLGLDILGESATPSKYRAQATLVDSRGALLLAKDLVDLQASRFEGEPSGSSPGRFQIWHDESWHLRANAACRATTIHVLLSDDAPLAEDCPEGWTCAQREIDPLVMPKELGGATYRRAIDVSVPRAGLGEWTFPIAGVARVDFESEQGAEVCPDLSNICGESPTETTASTALLGTRPGVLLTGRNGRPWCELLGSVALQPGLSSWSTDWNGLRPDGTIPAEGPAKLEVVAWDPSTGRVATGSATASIHVGEGKLHAWADGEVSIAEDAPTIQKTAGLGFSLEGRGALLRLEILSGDEVIATLPGSGEWFEGRSAANPYAARWDGRDATGSLVAPGTYRFRVREVDGDLMATGPVEVTGSSWKEDPGLALSIPESHWDAEAQAWRLEPKPELLVSTKASASYVPEGEFTYAADWSGKQLVTAFPAKRFSLMVHRQRKTVKFGILFRMVLEQYAYRSWKDPALEPLEAFSGVNVIEVHPGDIARIDVQAFARPTGGGRNYRFGGGPHHVEYRVVPLSEVARLNSINIQKERWESSWSNRLTSGYFRIKDLEISPSFGQFDDRPAVGPFDWNTPSNPIACEQSALDAFKDPLGKGVETGKNPCGSSTPLDLELHNPHRNLVTFRALPWIDEMRTRLVPTKNVVQSRHGTVVQTVYVPTQYRVLEYAHGSAESSNSGEAARNEFGFHFEFFVPEEYWNPPVGMENLANRFLRFDSHNKFLFGPNGYLLHDDFDNDGVGPIDDDDPGEIEGSLAAFQTKQFHWRPRLTDIFPSEVCTHVPEAGVDRCHTGPDVWSTSHGTREGDRILERPDEDPLYIAEGDHGRDPEVLRLWFENSPEQGDAVWTARISQREQHAVLSSRSNGPGNAISFPLDRGNGLGIVYDGTTIWGIAPIDIRVGLEGSLSDFQKEHWQTPMDWPLDASGYQREKTRIETECVASFRDPCRVFAAASGVRFGVDDGLEPRNPHFSSSAQEAFFQAVSAGIVSDPDAIHNGLPSGTGTTLHLGTLRADETGILRYADSDHFRTPPTGFDLLDAHVIPRVASWNGPPVDCRLELHPTPTALFWSGAPQRNTWSLLDDPRLAPAERLQVSRLWNPTHSGMRWNLLELYRSAVATPSASADDVRTSLFLDPTSTTLNPSLRALQVVDPRVAFRNGDDADPAFTISSIQNGSELPELQLERRAGSWGLPEWIPIEGRIANEEPFQIGWFESDGLWHPVGARQHASCTESELVSARCRLGFLDVRHLPSSTRIGILVGEGSNRRFQSIPVLQGKVVDPQVNQEVRSLFGEVGVTFPAGTLSGRTPAERSIVARSLDPAGSEARIPSGLAVTGPIVEVLPSQSFGLDQARQPQISVRLTKDEFDDLGSASGLGLFKIDDTSGEVFPLSERSTTYLCDAPPCDANNARAVEIRGTTASFSRFAILPLSTPDSRSWWFEVAPKTGRSESRTIHIEGISASLVDWALDDDADPEDPGDASAPIPLSNAVLTDESIAFTLPIGRWWIHARPRAGGPMKSVAVQRIAEDIRTRLLDLDTIFLGTVNGEAQRTISSESEGSWTLALQSHSEIAGFLEGKLVPPRSELVIPSDILGHRWRGSVSTRISFRDSDGEWFEQEGPPLVGDATLPHLQLEPRIISHGAALAILADASARDDEGPLRELRIQVRTMEGLRLRDESTSLGELSLEIGLDALAWSVGRIRISATAIDRGGNHVEIDTTLELPRRSRTAVLWNEAESLLPDAHSIPVCHLESRRAIRLDSATTLEWTLPPFVGSYRLAARWRSADSTRLGFGIGGKQSTEIALPARAQWGKIELVGGDQRIHGGDHLKLRLGAGTLWDGFALVADSSALESWDPPTVISTNRAEVWIRDEAPNDPVMVHPRFFVRNLGPSTLESYQVRFPVRTESDIPPVAQLWWPSTLETRWESEGPFAWSLVVDRTEAGLPPGGEDFQGIGAVLGVHHATWSSWNRLDDPAWLGGLSSGSMTRSRTIPVFDSAGMLLSDWECIEDTPWDSAMNPGEAVRELRSTGPLVLEAGFHRVAVVPEGRWAWQETVLGLSPVDGRIMEGFLRIEDSTSTLQDWWQELRVPNADQKPLTLFIEIPAGHRVQIQKWEE